MSIFGRTQLAGEQFTPEAESAFSQGLRSGSFSAAGQLNALAGGVAEAFGAEDFANRRYSASRELAERAAETAPPVQSYGDVRGLRTGFDYVTGLIGQSAPALIPAVGAGMLTRGRSVLASGGASAGALAPLEVGEAIQRQQEDPVALQATPGERLAVAGATGGASAALQGLVPGMVAHRLAGGTARQIAGRTTGQIVSRNLAAIPGEGLTEAGGELTQQIGQRRLSPDTPFDLDQLGEAFVGGLAVGAPLAGAGAVGEVAHARRRQILDAARSATDSVRTAAARLNPGADGPNAPSPMPPGGSGASAAPGPFFAVEDLAQSAMAATREGAEGIREAFARRFPDAAGRLDEVTTYLSGAVQQRHNQARAWVDDLLASEDLPGDIRARVEEAGKNLRDKANQAYVASVALARQAQAQAPEVLRRLRDSMESGARQGLAAADALATGADLPGAAEALAAGRATAQQVAQQRAQQAQALLRQVMASPRVGEAVKASLRAADVTSQAGQQIIARAAQAEVAANDALKAMSDFATRVARGAARPAGPQGAEDVRASDVGAGVREAIAEQLAPALREVAPDVLNDRQAMRAFADGMREFIRQASVNRGGQIDSDTILSLVSVLGDRTVSTLERVATAVQGGDGPAAENMFRTINEVVALQRGQASALDVMRSSVRPELQGEVTMRDLRNDMEALRQWARSTETGERARYIDSQVRALLEQRYGSGADAVLAAIEQSMPRDRLSVEAQDAADQGDSAGDRLFIGKGRNQRRRPGGKRQLKLLDSPEAEAARGDPHMTTTRMIERLQALHPDKEVVFLPAREYAQQEGVDFNPDTDAGKGVIEIRGQTEMEALSADDVSAMRFDSSAGNRRTNPSVIRTGEGDRDLFDARKITRTMEEKLPFNESDEQGVGYRKARAFMAGVAALQDSLGRSFDIPDSTVIANRLTYGDAKKLKFSTESSTGFEAEDRRTYERELTKVTTDVARLTDLEREGVLNENDAERLTYLRDREQFLERKLAFIEAQDRAAQADQDAGRQQIDPDQADVVTAAAQVGEREIRRKSSAPGGTTPLERDGVLTDAGKDMLKLKVKHLRQADQPQRRALGNRAFEVLKRWKDLTPEEKKSISRLAFARVQVQVEGEPVVMGDLKLSDMAEDINALHQKYAALPQEARANPADRVDDLVTREAYDEIANPRAMLSFLRAARQRFDSLMRQDEDFTPRQRDVIDKLGRLFDPTSDLEMMLKETDGWSQTSPELRERLIEEANKLNARPEVRAQAPKERVAAKQAAFLEMARSGEGNLTKALQSSDDARGLQRAAEFLNQQDLSDGSLRGTLEVVNERLDTLVQDDGVRYSMLLTNPTPGAGPDAATTKAVKEYIERVLGPKVKKRWSKMLGAGSYDPTQDLIRISVHSLDPMGAAYHESLHAYLKRLADAGQSELISVLSNAASTPAMRRQLRSLLAGEPDALRQIENSAEERMAYMYQFWAAGKLSVNPEPQTFLQRIASAIRSILGTWSNEQRAEHMLQHFHSGEFLKDSSRGPGAVRTAIMQPGTNALVEGAKRVASPLKRLGEIVALPAAARVRDSGVPALQQLVDTMRRARTETGDDPGFLPAARHERTKVMNRIGAVLEGMKAEDLDNILEGLQRGDISASVVTTPERRLAARAIRKELDSLFEYMQDAGVRVKDLGFKKDYFPRVWDPVAISENQAAFRAMLAKHPGIDADALIAGLVNSDGVQFTIETDRPGNQFVKERVLRDITAEEAFPFVKKDLIGILSSYATQATRRAEWARRLGDDSSRLDEMMREAKSQGASQVHIDDAKKFIRAVDGTLGDSMDPLARKWFGNVLVYQNIRLLPLAIVSSSVDFLGIAVRGGTVSDAFSAFKRGVAGLRHGWKMEYPKDAAERLAETMGVIDNAAMSATMSAMYSESMVGSTAKQINDAFFRYNLMESWNRSMRVAASQAALKFLARHKEGSSPHSQRWLAELGLTAGDIQVDADGNVANVMEPKVVAAVNRWVDGAILRPDAADKPVWMSDPRWALVAHLKQFVYAFQQTILARVAHEWRNGNYTPALAALSYIPVMIAADTVKALAMGMGEEPDWRADWDVGDHLWYGVERSGLLGVGQFAVDAGDGFSQLTGPTLEQFIQSVEVMGGDRRFEQFAVKSMPANALYKEALL